MDYSPKRPSPFLLKSLVLVAIDTVESRRNFATGGSELYDCIIMDIEDVLTLYAPLSSASTDAKTRFG